MVGTGKYFCKSTLIERGWTEQMISNILNCEDGYCDNPYYKCAEPMYLYIIERVQKAEKSKEFKKECKKAHPKTNDNLKALREKQDTDIKEYRKKRAKEVKFEAKRLERKKKRKEKD